MADDQSSVTLDFGEATPQQEFRSLEAFEKWFSTERAKWEWLTPGSPPLNIGNIAQHVTNQFNEVASHIAAANGQPDPLGYLKPQLDARWGSGGFLRYSDGELGSTILDIREAGGDEAAAFAYAFIKQQVNAASAANLNQLRGAMLLALPGMAGAADLADRLSKERNNFKAAQASAVARIEKAQEAQAERFEKLVKRGRKVTRRLVRSRYQQWKTLLGNWMTQANASKADIDAVRHAYEESMRLQGPVRYWTAKAKEHGRKEFWAAVYVAAFFVLGGAALFSAFDTAGAFVVETSRAAVIQKIPQPTPLYVLITGGLAALSTLVFWIGRLLTKLWLSEHHLRNDAHERAVMTTTYLALTRNEKAEEADRQIILTALFRSTPDGIVKDDGADFGLQAFLAKQLTRP